MGMPHTPSKKTQDAQKERDEVAIAREQELKELEQQYKMLGKDRDNAYRASMIRGRMESLLARGRPAATEDEDELAGKL